MAGRGIAPGGAATSIVAGIIAALTLAPAASAATIKVTTSRDTFDSGGACSIREAIQNANTDAGGHGCTAGTGPGDVINLNNRDAFLERDPVGNPDDNLTGDLDISDGVTIVGDKRVGARIDGNSVDRSIEIEGVPSTERVTLLRLSLGNSIAQDNLSGGIIRTTGPLTIKHGELSLGASSASGGLIAAVSGGSLEIRNSSLYAGFAADDGGAIFTSGALSLRNVSIVDNVANDPTFPGSGTGGSIFRQGTAPFVMKNTILSKGHDGFTANECGGTIPSAGHNLVETVAGCGYSAGPGDIIGRKAKLAGIPDLNGGPVETFFVPPGSPAVNRGAGCERIDARGVPRKLGGRCDIGGYERVKCAGRLVTVVGTAGRDRLVGFSGRSVLALGGRDLVKGTGKSEAICGGPGRDRLLGRGGRDKLIGGTGLDRLIGGPGLDLLRQ